MPTKIKVYDNALRSKGSVTVNLPKTQKVKGAPKIKPVYEVTNNIATLQWETIPGKWDNKRAMAFYYKRALRKGSSLTYFDNEKALETVAKVHGIPYAFTVGKPVKHSGKKFTRMWLEAQNSKKSLDLAVKFVDGSVTRIRDYACLWGGPDQPDLSPHKDFFTKQTDTWDGRLGFPRPLTYHHGFEKNTKSHPLVGTIVEMGEDEVGKWYEAELDKSHKYYSAIAKMIQQRALKSSSDSVPQYVQREPQPNGTHWLKAWPLFGVSLTPTPAEPRMYGAQEVLLTYKSLGVDLTLPVADVAQTPAANLGNLSDNGQSHKPPADAGHISQEARQMEAKEIRDAVAAELKAQQDYAAKFAADEAEAKKKFDAEVEAKVQAALKAYGGRRLPFAEGSAISVSSKYDGMDTQDLAMLATLRIAGKSINRSAGADEELRRALAAKSFKAIEQGTLEAKAMVDAEFKANEVMQSTLASYGDEWVTTNFSTQLWLKARGKSRLLDKLPSQEIPKGFESETIPLESTDFTFYNVAQAATEDVTMKTVPATVTSSKMGTAQKVITVGKLGARGYIAGELDEDSIIEALPEARRQLERQLPEELDFLLFNGDTTAATDNMNGAGTPVTGADYTTLIGILRLGIKTNTANQKDMGAAIDSTKINALYQTLGTDGFYVAEDPTACVVFCDYSTWWKVLGMSDLLTVSNAGEKVATIANGALPDQGIPVLGVKWYPSVGVKKAQATGIRHGTEGSNTLGRAVLMKPDLWKLRWKRRAKFETTRVAYADLTELVVTLRLGIGYFDTDAASVAFNI